MEFQKKILALIKSGVMPALGCTEPGAVHWAAAYAGQVLGDSPVRVWKSVLIRMCIKMAWLSAFPVPERSGLR